MRASTHPDEVPRPSARLDRAERLLLWLAANLLWCAVVAWVAFQIQQDEIAPAVLFPLAVGAALGAGSYGIRRWTQCPGVRLALAAAALWGLLVVVGQDYIGHRYHQRAYDAIVQEQTSLAVLATAEQHEMRSGFAAYLAGRVRQHPVWWSLDVGLTAFAAMAVTGLGLRREQLRGAYEA